MLYVNGAISPYSSRETLAVSALNMCRCLFFSVIQAVLSGQPIHFPHLPLGNDIAIIMSMDFKEKTMNNPVRVNNEHRGSLLDV